MIRADLEELPPEEPENEDRDAVDQPAGMGSIDLADRPRAEKGEALMFLLNPGASNQIGAEPMTLKMEKGREGPGSVECAWYDLQGVERLRFAALRNELRSALDAGGDGG